MDTQSAASPTPLTLVTRPPAQKICTEGEAEDPTRSMYVVHAACRVRQKVTPNTSHMCHTQLWGGVHLLHASLLEKAISERDGW